MGITTFWGVDFCSEGLTLAADRMIRLAKDKSPVSVRLVNANSVSEAEKDETYRRVLMSNGINYADGAPLAALLSLASRRQGGESQQRVRGPSLFEETLRRSEGHAITHLFFGGSKDAIARLEDNVSSRYPFVAAAGYISPPIASANDLAELAARAHADYGGDIVWIGLGQPKQDIVAHLLADQISRPCIGIGAAFDFFAGTVRTAPQWMQASGTEWLYRFAHEPRRLWRRYTIGNMRFLRVASREIGRTRCDRP